MVLEVWCIHLRCFCKWVYMVFCKDQRSAALPHLQHILEVLEDLPEGRALFALGTHAKIKAWQGGRRRVGALEMGETNQEWRHGAHSRSSISI